MATTLASGSIDLKGLKTAGKEVNKYITTINDGGIKVHDIDKQNIDYAQIDSTGLTVYQNTAKVAEFGSSIRLGLNEAQVIIGNENGTNQTSHITIDNGGINIYRESDLVMHLGEHTTIGRENKSQLAIENGFLQFSSYVGSARIPQFEIGDANTTRTTYTPLLAQEIEIGNSYFTDNNPDDNRWPQGGDFEIFYNPNEPLQPDAYGSVTVEDYYIDDPEHYDYGDPTWYASVIKVCLGNLGNNFNPNSSDLYLGFNEDTIVDNYYQNASTLIDSRPIRWFLYTEGGITYLILPLNFVTRSGSNPYVYHWNAGGTELIRPNGRFTNMSIMLYKCDNPNASYSSFEPYLTFGNRTSGYSIGNYSVTFGKNLINNQEGCFVVGQNNAIPNNGDLFVIGTGTSTSNRSNLFVVNSNGSLRVTNNFSIESKSGAGLNLNGENLILYDTHQNDYFNCGLITTNKLLFVATKEITTQTTATQYVFGHYNGNYGSSYVLYYNGEILPGAGNTYQFSYRSRYQELQADVTAAAVGGTFEEGDELTLYVDYQSTSLINSSLAFGQHTATTIGPLSTILGSQCQALGMSSLAAGVNIKVYGMGEVGLGRNNTSSQSGGTIFTVGDGTPETSHNAIYVDSSILMLQKNKDEEVSIWLDSDFGKIILQSFIPYNSYQQLEVTGAGISAFLSDENNVTQNFFVFQRDFQDTNKPILSTAENTVITDARLYVQKQIIANSYYVTGHSSAIGTIISKGDTGISRASGTTFTNLSGMYVDVTPGTWAFEYSVYCDVNKANSRLGGRLYNNTSSTEWNFSRSIAYTSGTAAIAVTGSAFVNFSTNSRIYVQAFQNGNATTVSAYLRAVRIS